MLLLDITDQAMVQVLFVAIVGPVLVLISLYAFVQLAVYRKQVQFGLLIVYGLNGLVLSQRLIIEPESVGSFSEDYVPWMWGLIEEKNNVYSCAFGVLLAALLLQVIYSVSHYRKKQ